MSESVYSFDAPNFIDFQALNEQYDNDADSWFDHTVDAENVPPNRENSFMRTPASKNHVPRDVVTPIMRSDENAESQIAKTSDNIATSLESWRTKVRTVAAGVLALGTRSKRSSWRLSLQQKKKQLAKIQENRRTVATTPTSDRHPLIKKQKLRKPLNNKLKSTEDQELDKMLQLQQEVMEQRRKNEESLKAAIAGTGQPVKKTTCPTTRPIDFHFHTDDRLKRFPESQPADEFKEVDFTSALRRHPPSPARIPKGRHTVPKLSQGNKRKLEEEIEPSKFVSMAQQMEAFYKHTLSRYHLQSRQQQNEGPSPVKCVKPKLTQPKTPQLETKRRHRPVTCKSTAELEAEELEELQQSKFHAQELDRRVLDGDLVLTKKQSVKEPTKPIGFNLELEKRIQEREAKKEETEEEKYTFHSRPCPTKMLEEVVGVPEKKCLAPTVPKSPAFTLKNRVRRPAHEEEQEELPLIKANPMPHYGVPFKPKSQEQRQIKPAPFSFDSRDQKRRSQKEKKLEELRKEEVPTFKALLLPDFDQISLPEKKVKTPTHPEPFHLQTEERAAKKTQRWKQQVHKAQPVRKYKTLDVKASVVPLTIPKSPTFSDRFQC